MADRPLLTFATLRSVGYQSCAHPRVAVGHCRDCGARWATRWVGGGLDFPREPWELGEARGQVED